MLERVQSRSGAKHVGFPTGSVLSARHGNKLKGLDIEYCETAKTLVKPKGRNPRLSAVYRLLAKSLIAMNPLRERTWVGAVPLGPTRAVARYAVFARKTSWSCLRRVSTVHLWEFAFHAGAAEPVRLLENPDRNALRST